MTIAIIGAGAIGSLVAAYLAKAGIDVCLIGRPEQVAAITRNGLRVKSAQGQETFNVKALDRLDKEYDLIIFAVKTQDLESAFQHNHPYLENGLVLTTQNGVQADNMLCTHFELSTMYSSIVMFGATYVTDGEVTFNFPGDWILGKPFQPNDTKVTELANVLGRAFPVVISTNIMGMKWLKLFVNFNNCIPALFGKSMQETFSDLDLCRLSIKLLKEGVQLVQNAGIEMTALPNFPVDRILGLAQMPEDQAAGILQKTMTGLSKEPLYGSILQSLMRGKPTEIDFINGEVVQLARTMQTKAPLNDRIVNFIHQIEQNGRFFSQEAVKKEFGL
jgi:2-dehydropantoate 2-reductase